MAGGGLQERLWRGEACRPTRFLHTHTIKNNIYIHTTTQVILVLVSSLLSFTIHYLYVIVLVHSYHYLHSYILI